MEELESNEIKTNFFKYKIILIIFSIFISLFCLEIILRVINYPYQSCEEVYQASETWLGEFDEKTGWSYKKNFSFDQPDMKYNYFFDENGIRVKSKNYKINHDKKIIAFVGGSVTFGEGLPFEETFAYKVGDLLGNDFEVVNLGIQGFGTAQSYLHLKELIDVVKPDFVVYTFIPDHINRDVNYDRRIHVKCFEFNGTKPVFELQDGVLNFYRLPKRYNEVDKLKIVLFLDNVLQLNRENKLLDSDSARSLTKATINEMSSLINSDGAEDFYIYYDTIYDDSADSYNDFLFDYIFDDDKKERVLNFTNWATDSSVKGTKYFVNESDNYHPNAILSNKIAEFFVEKFSADFKD